MSDKTHYPPEFTNPSAYETPSKRPRAAKTTTPRSARTKDRGTAQRKAVARSARDAT